MKLEFSGQIFEKKNLKYDIVKIRPVEAELFHADRRTDIANLVVAFLKFAKAPNNGRAGELSKENVWGPTVAYVGYLICCRYGCHCYGTKPRLNIFRSLVL